MKVLRISPELTLPIDSATETFGFLGQRGAGKSNAEVVFAEEMHKAGVPWVAIDPKGDWYGIRSSSDGDKPGLSIPVLGGLHGDSPIAVSEGAQWADVLVDATLTAVVDVSDFSKGERARFLVAFFDRLYKRHRGDPHVRHVFLEEAHEYIPQQMGREEGALKEAAARIVLQGRSFGLGSSTCSQRSARIHKDVLTQIGTLIAMRTTAPHDRKAIEEWVKVHDVDGQLVASLPELHSGEAWVWSPEFLQTMKRIRFRRRETFDSGATPKVGAVTRTPKTLADVDLAAIKEQMAESIEKAEAADPVKLNRRIRDLERELRDVRKDRVIAGAAEPTVEYVDRPVVTDDHLAALTHIAEELNLTATSLSINAQTFGQIVHDLSSALGQVGAQPRPVRVDPVPPAKKGAVPDRGPHTAPPAARNTARSRGTAEKILIREREGQLEYVNEPRQKILDAIAWYNSVGVVQPNRSQVAFVAGTTPTSSGYDKNVGALRTAGLLDYPGPGLLVLTDEGAAIATAAAEISTTAELIDVLGARLGRPKAAILHAVADAYPDTLTREELAELVNVSPLSSGFDKNIGSLRSLGYLEYPQAGAVRATPMLFIDETR